jgi:hypothetical protein
VQGWNPSPQPPVLSLVAIAIKAYQENWGYGAVMIAIAPTVVVFPQWFQPLLAVNGLISHGHCSLWKPGLVWLHLVSDSLIALAHVATSAILAYLVYKTRQEIPFQTVAATSPESNQGIWGEVSAMRIEPNRFAATIPILLEGQAA